MYTKLVTHHNQIQVYYSKNGKILRHPTKVKATPFFNECKFGFKEPNFRDKNQVIADAQQKVEDLILSYLKDYNDKPPVSWLKGQLANPETKQEVVRYETVDELYNQYFLQKKQSIIKEPSLKDYTSFKNALLLFQYKKKIKLGVEDINKVSFLKEFELFLITPQDLTPEEKKIYRTSCGQNDNTARKRTDTLRAFISWLVDNGYVKKNNLLKRKMLESYPPTIVVFTDEELTALKELDLEEDEGRTRDLMLFLCSTALRYSDAVRISKGNVTNGTLYKDAKKVKERSQIPLTAYAIEILEKYEYRLDFNSYAQVFNRKIQKLLKDHNICNYNITLTEYRGNEPYEKEVLKLTKISSHTGRRTWISRAIRHRVPLDAIMKVSGHHNLTTLKKYIQIFDNTSSDDLIRGMTI